MQKTIINYNKMIYDFMIFIKLKHQTKPVATQRAYILLRINILGVLSSHADIIILRIFKNIFINKFY